MPVSSPWNWFLQVNQDDVAFDNLFKTEKELEYWVTKTVYPPAITCAVMYGKPLDFGQASSEVLKVIVTGTDKPPISFPIKVYRTSGECVLHFTSEFRFYLPLLHWSFYLLDCDITVKSGIYHNSFLLKRLWTRVHLERCTHLSLVERSVQQARFGLALVADKRLFALLV